MKKFIIILAVALGIFGVSQFVYAGPPVNTSTDNENIITSTAPDGWEVFRTNVAYCTDENTCAGYGIVWLNRSRYQVGFSIGSSQTIGEGSIYDMGEYTGKDGYNMRFWHKRDNKYYYVNIYIPRAAWDY